MKYSTPYTSRRRLPALPLQPNGGCPSLRDLQPRWRLTDHTTRRDMLSNIAKVLPLAAVAAVAGEQSSSAAPKGGNSATALVNTVTDAGAFVGTVSVTGVQLVNGVLNAVGT